MIDVIVWTWLAVVLIIIVGGMFKVWWEPLGGRTWCERRQLVKLAHSYGIEYVPGEDLDKLRARIVKRRDKIIGDE